MSEDEVIRGKEPSVELKMWFAEALSALNEFEEHESASFCDQLLKRGPPSTFHTVNIGEHLSWLNYMGLISYREIIRNGHRLVLKREASVFKIRKVLTGGAGPAPESAVEEETKKEKPKGKKKGKKKAAKKAEPPPPEPAPEPDPPKKKRKCCDDPHVVRSRKTGKRRCKNCGKKYKSKEPKE